MFAPTITLLSTLETAFKDSDRVALTAFGERLQVPLKRALRKNAFDRIEIAAWSSDATALRSHFRIRDSHCFNVAPHRWFALSETQVTRGFEHFLTADTPTQRLSRVRSSLRSCLPGRDDLLGPEVLLSCPAAVAEARAKVRRTSGNSIGADKRIDLIVSLRCGNQLVGAVIEAKLDHFLKNPLQTYEAHARRAGFRTGSAAFLVVGGRLPAKLRKGWAFVSWRTLLLRYEQQLEDSHDDLDFRRFRRSLWDRIS